MNALLSIDEKELLSNLRDRDQMTFEKIFKHFHPALVFFANRLLVNQDMMEAEEVVQDSLLKFYARSDNFTSLQSIKAFLYITTKNSCLQIIAKEQTRKKRFDLFISGFNEVQHAVENEIIYAEVLREVSMAIDLLPQQCRQIMKLIFEEGLNAKQISQELNVTVSTVNSQKARAISILKKQLSDAGKQFLLFFL